MRSWSYISAVFRYSPAEGLVEPCMVSKVQDNRGQQFCLTQVHHTDNISGSKHLSVFLSWGRGLDLHSNLSCKRMKGIISCKTVWLRQGPVVPPTNRHKEFSESAGAQQKKKLVWFLTKVRLIPLVFQREQLTHWKLFFTIVSDWDPSHTIQLWTTTKDFLMFFIQKRSEKSVAMALCNYSTCHFF